MSFIKIFFSFEEFNVQIFQAFLKTFYQCVSTANAYFVNVEESKMSTNYNNKFDKCKHYFQFLNFQGRNVVSFSYNFYQCVSTANAYFVNVEESKDG